VFPLVRKYSQAEVAAIARCEADRRAWQWSGPERFVAGPFSYRVFPASYSGGPWSGPWVLVSSVWSREGVGIRPKIGHQPCRRPAGPVFGNDA
jgi:hypothetical protein